MHSFSSHVPIWLLLLIKGVVLLVKVPFYAGYGAWRLLAGLAGVTRQLLWSRRLLEETLTCGSCGERNVLHGRWQCAACSGVYHGFVGECPLCGAGAAFFPCGRCQVSLPLGPRR